MALHPEIPEFVAALQKAVATFESGFSEVQTGPAAYIAATGEPYITSAFRCDKPLVQVVEAWKQGTELLFAGKGGRLIWRIRPKIEVNDDGGVQVYSRLLVTDKPDKPDLVAQFAQWPAPWGHVAA